jgi:hypothetical protein
MRIHLTEEPPVNARQERPSGIIASVKARSRISSGIAVTVL